MPVSVEVVETAPAIEDLAAASPGAVKCRRSVGLAGGIWQRRYDWDALGADRLGGSISPDIYVGCALGSGVVRVSAGMESAPFLKLASADLRDDDAEITMWVAPHLDVELHLGQHVVVAAGLVLGVPQVGGDIAVRFYPTPKIRAEGLEVRAAVYAFGPSSRLLVGYTWDAGARHVRK